ncbi:hypothetical protein ACFV4N_29065 [Actinosynnema sp. NPDC059797]
MEALGASGSSCGRVRLVSLGDATRNGKVIAVSAGGSRGYLVPIADPAGEGLFEEWPTALLPTGPVAAFSLDYRDPTVVLEVVAALASLSEVLVDTNQGSVVPGDALTIEDLLGHG